MMRTSRTSTLAVAASSPGGLGGSTRVEWRSRAIGRAGSGAQLRRPAVFRAGDGDAHPYVSAGLIARNDKQPVVVVAVPTFDRPRAPAGVLAGSILLKTVGREQAGARPRLRQPPDHRPRRAARSRRSEAGRESLAARADPQRRRGRVRQQRVSTDAARRRRVRDLEGWPGWVTVIDRPRSTVFASALGARARACLGRRRCAARARDPRSS